MEWDRPVIEHLVPTKWCWVVSYPENLYLGDNVDIGAFTYIQAFHGVHIAAEVQIGSHCSIYSESSIDNKQGAIKIRKGARIGTHSTIMPGVTIERDKLIPAYSMVTPKGVYTLKREKQRDRKTS